MKRLPCPSLSVIGNHDIFWKDSHASPAGDPKRRAMIAYGMPSRYYSHQAGGWKFLLLDTFHADGCRIDDSQFNGSSASCTRRPARSPSSRTPPS